MTAHPALAGSPLGGTPAGAGTGCDWLAPVLRMAAMASGNWPLSPRPDGRGWTCFPRVATRTSGTDGRAVRAGREFTAATARRWDAEEREDDLAIVVSELLTNAVCHGLTDAGPARPSPVRLGLLQPGRCVICAVADPSSKLPLPRRPGPLTESGRGLHVIEALADAWGCTPPGRAGKVVWALFCLRGSGELPAPIPIR